MEHALLEFGRWVGNPRYFLIEEVVLVCLLATAIAAPWLAHGAFGRFEAVLGRFARRTTLACISVALAPVAIRVLLLPLFPVPYPQVHDEFSLLLGADTFASGRLTNPTHPMWPHFESFHTLQQPTYMSIYPPAQALLLALGQVLGHPWIGVLLGAALMGGAVTWMLQGWLPPGWALLGGVLAAGRLGLFSYWTNSYWGGSLAAAAGALLLGVAGRLWRGAAFSGRLGAVAALGAIVLLNRRPYEGMILCASAGVLMVLCWIRARLPKAGLAFAGAFVALAAPALAWVLLFHARVTGDPFRMPYLEGIQRYGQAAHLVILPSKPAPEYRLAVMRDFYEEEMNTYRARRASPLATYWTHLVNQWRFYMGPALSVALVGIPVLWRSRRLRPLVVLGAVALGATSIEVWLFPHYSAPWTALGIALMAAMLRRLYHRRRTGPALVRAVVSASLVVLLIPPVSAWTGIAWPPVLTGFWNIPVAWQRPAVEADLKKTPGLHLVLVRYGDRHNVHSEWVYNGADLEGAKVVWARSLGEAEDRKLLEYYVGRRVWRVDEQAGRAALTPVPSKVPGQSSD